MYYFDQQRHRMPQIHVRYGDQEAVLSLPEGQLLEGELQRSKMKLVLAWIEIHREELMANWQLATQGEQIFRIDPLR